jgi:hypothetical protein
MVEEHTDIKHRRLSSLTPDEYQTVEALLSLLGASIEDDGGGGHLTLNVSRPPFTHNALRIPTTCTIDELVGWARLLNRREAK